MGTTDMTKVLTTNECSLLERYYDGDPLAEAEVTHVEELLNNSPTARVFMNALEELTIAVQAAEQHVWDTSDAPSADQVFEAAMRAATLADSSLEDLAPLLERFFDGEVVAEEMIAVQALINERDDVTEYLSNLDGLRASVRVGNDQLVDGVSFDRFWESIAERIDDGISQVEPQPIAAAFDPEQRVLLYRYHDAEVTAEERAQVDAWVAEGAPEVIATLTALAELRFATVAAIETAQERADFTDLWHRIEEGIDDQVEAQGENVVSLARQKRERTGLPGDSRAAAWSAIAAMLFVAFGAALFKDQLFAPTERVIVEKTVVIVDSVEYQPGSSVIVNAPMKPVSSISAALQPGEEAVEEEPTVIWLLDSAPEAGAPSDTTLDVQDETNSEENTHEETSDQPI